ncbi:hypothetical protein EB796_011522 [Bugula neritina]|uniref:Uncharacterized protein n=1 Tax=Bugula neritina TaxID=10212 RepID=A0A7J7JUW1_BUGNE|nr:hypothetical protein EB796_011522 [Bugula neritina]
MNASVTKTLRSRVYCEMIAVLDGQHFEKALYCSCLMEKEDSTQPDVILARRSSDGYLTFDLKISHLIEQTLRRALNKPGFRKSTIKILEEGEEDPGIGSKAATAIIQSASSPPTPASSYSPKSLVPVKRTYSDSSLYTPCNNNSILPHSSSTQSSGITAKDREQFERSIANASLCPHDQIGRLARVQSKCMVV